MIQATSCPSAAVLQRLLLGQSAEEESVSLEEHLLHCEKCLRTMQTLSPDDALISALQQGCESVTPAPSSELLDKVRRQLREMRPPSAGMDQPIPGDTLGAAPSPTDATQDVSVPLAPAQLPDEIGRLGGYRILKELGRGGMGVVYQAEDPKLKRLVALKAMLPRLAADPASHQRFLREAQAMAAVHHDHIVTVFQVDEDKGVPFLAMEFLQGMPLDRWLKEGRKATVAQVLRIGREIAEGLAAAHERGLIHRDIKPGNIWLDSDHKGRVKILDFGLARVGTDDVHLTRSGAIVGTPAYMSPEQARGEKVDGRCDLFSLGCVLYKLCTGVMPFAGDTTMGLLMSLALDQPKTVREINPDVPVALADLVTRLLAKRPEERPQSAREVVQAIQAISRAPEDRAAESISAVGTNPIGTSLASRTETVAVLPSLAPASGGKKRRPWALAAVAAGFLATAITVAIVIIIRDKNGNEVAKINVQPGYHAELVDNEKRDAPVAAPKVALDDAWVKGVAGLFPKQQIEAVVAELKKRNPEFDGQVQNHTKDGVVVELRLAADHVADISPLRALVGLQVLHCGTTGSASPLADLSPLKGMKLTELDFPHTQVSDLSPLKGMPLTSLACSGARVADLSPLKEAPLTSLDVTDNRAVSDLAPLHGAPLTTLLIGNTSVEDLSPLKGMALTHLNFSGTLVSDVTPLAGMPLTDLVCGGTGLSDLSWLKPMKLTSLDCDRLHVSDLSPLKDMKLTTLICFGTQVSDLSPLKGMPLTNLYCANTKVSDLSPLKGMPLTALNIPNTPVSDLSPLTGMKLELLDFDHTPVSDLSPLKGMPLRQLQFGATKVSNLSPLNGMPLQFLVCDCKPERDGEVLRSIRTLETINYKPAAEFWKEVDAKPAKKKP
jgi:serine/threonine protein kinase/Leucine-rich repeat (LRR) protein